MRLCLGKARTPLESLRARKKRATSGALLMAVPMFLKSGNVLNVGGHKFSILTTEKRPLQIDTRDWHVNFVSYTNELDMGGVFRKPRVPYGSGAASRRRVLTTTSFEGVHVCHTPRCLDIRSCGSCLLLAAERKHCFLECLVLEC